MNPRTGVKCWKETIRLLALARNAIVVVLGILAAYIFEVNGSSPFLLTGTITGGMPPFQPPPFSTIAHNRTVSFQEMTQEMGTSIISIPLISILETIAIAKAFGKLLPALSIICGYCLAAAQWFRTPQKAAKISNSSLFLIFPRFIILGSDK